MTAWKGKDDLPRVVDEMVAKVHEYRSIDALCARHGITVDGVVALVDEVMTERPSPGWFYMLADEAVDHMRRLARGEGQ